jgi:hypothetical protein
MPLDFGCCRAELSQCVHMQLLTSIHWSSAVLYTPTVCSSAADLASGVHTGPGLSSPHLRTHSASEPPRSVVLLGKRSAGAGDDAEETPVSRRSVRQRMDSGMLFWPVCAGSLVKADLQAASAVHRLDGSAWTQVC